MTLTPYDEGYFDGYFGSRPNNPYRRGTGAPRRRGHRLQMGCRL